jgi:DNA-binding HxlR family transcriptional regulator
VGLLPNAAGLEKDVKRKSFEDSACAIARTLDMIGDWWTLLILRDAFEGYRRFSEFEKSLGIPKNRLSLRLKSMVADGLLELAPASDGSAYQEYQLTEKGKGLFNVMVALRQWGEEHLFEGAEPEAKLVDKLKGRPVGRLILSSQDGRPLHYEDTLVTYSR